MTADQFFAPAELRVPPGAIPAVKEVLQKMLDDIRTPLEKLGRIGWMDDAWLGDPVSVAVKDAYNAHVMDAPDGMYQAIIKYRGQIQAAIDALGAAEKHYDHTESELVLKLT